MVELVTAGGKFHLPGCPKALNPSAFDFASDKTIEEVLRAQRAPGRIPPCLSCLPSEDGRRSDARMRKKAEANVPAYWRAFDNKWECGCGALGGARSYEDALERVEGHRLRIHGVGRR